MHDHFLGGFMATLINLEGSISSQDHGIGIFRADSGQPLIRCCRRRGLRAWVGSTLHKEFGTCDHEISLVRNSSLAQQWCVR